MAQKDTTGAAGAKALTSYLADNADKVMLGALKGALVIALCAIGAYIIAFKGQPFVVDPESWGQLGDYVGGILNPIFGFLSVLGLLIALVLQTTELKLSREALLVSQKELELSRAEQAKASEALASQNKSILKQSFEQTFFAWLGTYREILREIVKKRQGTSSYGRDELRNLWLEYLETRYFVSRKYIIQATINKAGVPLISNLPVNLLPEVVPEIKTEWENAYKDNEQNLGSFFRTAYRLIKWIDNYPSDILDNEAKYLYVGIFRSQLSWIEMVFLFYNGMTPRGEKFKPLIEKYALFDNLTIESDALLAILKECPMDGIGYAPSAFNSDIARENAKNRG